MTCESKCALISYLTFLKIFLKQNGDVLVVYHLRVALRPSLLLTCGTCALTLLGKPSHATETPCTLLII